MGDLCSTGTHGGEGFVTRGVHECDFLAVDFDLVCTDMLSNATGFAGRDLCFADGVEQGCFAMIDVSHDGDDRRDNYQVVFSSRGPSGFSGSESPTCTVYRRTVC